MNKKAIVISVMIIIGIVILTIFFFAFAMRSQLVNLIKPKTTDVSAVQIYVEDCVDAVSQFAFYKIGKQGGSISLRPAYFSNPFLEVNYAFDGVKTFFTLDEMKSNAEAFINTNLKNCTAGFKGFALKGVNVNEGDVSANIMFAARSTIVTVSYPLQIVEGDKTFSLDKFQRDIPVTLRRIQLQNDAFLSGFGDRYNLTYLRNVNSNIYIIPFSETDLFVEENLDSRILKENYLFLFAVK